tara:strand:- start:2311 stop:3645 length:1335 start_codon:yes stop_codon:yes gene_type:complete
MLHEPIRIGLVEDDPVMGESLVQRLALEGHDVRWWQTGGEALDAITAAPSLLDLVVCDIRLPDMNGEDLFRDAGRNAPVPPFLFVTAFGDIDQAVRLMRSGAGDYVTKPFDVTSFIEKLASQARPRHDRGAAAVLGRSSGMQAVENLLRRVADIGLPLLLTGETGVGKEVAARFVHDLSMPDRPFVAVNCAAIPAELLESELFGHEKGSFSGAHQRHLGLAERARDGMLFLDEIGDMPLNLQAKLLRLIEDRLFFRIGGEEPVPFRARIVSATHADVETEAKTGGFRQDLLYRLNAIAIEIPPLRKRPDDIPWLMHRFVRDAAETMGVDPPAITPLAEEAAITHDWPGNARELRNRMTRAVALAQGPALLPADIFPDEAAGAEPEPSEALSTVRDAAEARQIARVLQATGGQIAETARRLGVSRTTLWEKMRRLKLAEEDRSES